MKDTAEAFIEIAKSDSLIGQDCNIATEQEISIGDLAQLIISKINPKAKIVTEEQRLRPEKSEVFRLLGSRKKLEELTGWKTKVSLDEGINQTIEWFSSKENLKQYKANIYNL